MAIPTNLLSLIEKFKQHEAAYKSGKYNETQLRREFLDPFFEAQGWDVFNKQAHAESYKEVVHEDSIKIREKGKKKEADVISTKAPDYSFRIGGQRKFFVEAKKPSVFIRDDIAPAYQVRRYGWSANLSLSILSDFEEFAVYDTSIKPYSKDSAAVGRVFYCKFTEYPHHWEWIESIFSKEAILKGSFDHFAKNSRGKKGTATVDKEFLKEIESWRLELAKNIALRNRSEPEAEMDSRTLHFAVGATIDRLLFLRICEDRGIEPYGQLLGISQGKNIYSTLKELYYKADQKYNSGLFHFSKEKNRKTFPDEITPALQIDDKVLKTIIGNLYYPNSPYEFSVIGADILGNVYEQFLGKVIRLTGKSAKVEEKPEVKKAGGVYYTPKYIVEYIVQKTLGEKLKNRTPAQVSGESGDSPLRVLDPACGSGSFLIVAYQYLLDWYLNWYVGNYPEKHKKVVFQVSENNWQLTASERKKILLTHIYGVDIDAQAAEVTKLNLLLKVLEGQSAETIESQFSLFHERALPDLDSNIKCGNSLVGPDFYEVIGESQKELFTFTEEEKWKVNIFDWQYEFAEAMQAGGFNVVIENPPYVRQEILGTPFKKYAEKKYQTFAGTADLYVYFIEKSLSVLKDDGLYSVIVANKWLRANYGKSLRVFLKGKRIYKLIDFGDLPVFQGATTYPCILIAANKKAQDFDAVQQHPGLLAAGGEELNQIVEKNSYSVAIDSLKEEGWSLSSKQEAELLQKLKGKGIPLGEYVDGKIYRGVLTGLNEAFVIDEVTKDKLIAEDPKSAEVIKPFLAGRDIKRYQTPVSDRWLIFTRRGIDIKRYPAIIKYLEQFKDQLKPKPKTWPDEKGWTGRKPGSYEWYEIQDAVDYYEEFEKEKIIYPNICKQPEFVYDKNNLYTNQKCFIISEPDKYLLGILNSSVNYYLFNRLLPKLRGGFFEPSSVFFTLFPIRTIDFTNPGDKAMHDQMVGLVERTLEMHRRLPYIKTPHERTALEREIEATNRQIDQLVYRLYALTEEEIAVVEGSR